jgi:hypothetical protein
LSTFSSSTTSYLPDQIKIIKELQTQKTSRLLQSKYLAEYSNKNHLRLPIINKEMGSTRNNINFLKKSESDAKRVPEGKVKIFRSDKERDKELN